MHDMGLLWQVFGLFTVLATATGCLYFMDSNAVASKTGKDAAGVLLLLLNAFFVLWMLVLLVKASMADIKKHARWAICKVKTVPKQASAMWAGITSNFARNTQSTQSRGGANTSSSNPGPRLRLAPLSSFRDRTASGSMPT